MPVYRLIDDIVFPPPQDAESDGLLAVGGDLGPERLLMAYQLGIFPWYMEGQPILWWSPDPRLILELDDFHVSKRLGYKLRKEVFRVTFDHAFAKVINGCATAPRKGEPGTWITLEMEKAYVSLHRLGFAHSVESWVDGELVWGVYGVSLGRCFFAESMFFRKPDASKVAMAGLVRQLKAWKFRWLDAQVPSGHLLRLGAKAVSRACVPQKAAGSPALPDC